MENGDIKVEYCWFEQHVADIFTKPLGIATFVHIRDCIGVDILALQRSLFV